MSFIKFLGTAGARFVMIKQLRSSAGIWLNYKSTNVIIDPGPGAIVRCNSAKPKLDPSSLDAIILTHKHLDHSGDVNVMIEAMTEGGFRKRGILFVPSDALGNEGVVFYYLQGFVEKTIFLKKGEFSVGDISFEVPLRNPHPVETYGLKFFIEGDIISFLSDTNYSEYLIDTYKGSTVIVLNVVFYQKREEIEHLCLEEAIEIIKKIKPKKAIITHFGMSMLKAKPHLLGEKIKKQLNMDIRFAYDGMTLDIP
jgi:phosphoribosyl 1,2-cyclic phosphodiesterase